MNYQMETVTAAPNEDIIPIIRKRLEDKGWRFPMFQLHFLGFQADAGIPFKVNGNHFVVPLNSYYITPYDGVRYWNIKTFSFDYGCKDLDIYYIV